jgi:hypothetical protein
VDDHTPAPPAGRAYKPLGDYLQRRFADRVVLTFAQIEDLLGFVLPDAARVTDAWWLEGSAALTSPQSTSWIGAARTATVNRTARTVIFDRRST